MYLVSIRIFSYVTSNIIITLRKFITCHPYQIQSFAMIAHYKYVFEPVFHHGSWIAFFSYLVSLFYPDFFSWGGERQPGDPCGIDRFWRGQDSLSAECPQFGFLWLFYYDSSQVKWSFFFFFGRVPHRWCRLLLTTWHQEAHDIHLLLWFLNKYFTTLFLSVWGWEGNPAWTLSTMLSGTLDELLLFDPVNPRSSGLHSR